MAKFGSKLREIYNNLKADNKITNFQDDEFQQINSEINKEVREFRLDYSQKEEKSIKDTSEITLNS